jgi:hypothetical protein
MRRKVLSRLRREKITRGRVMKSFPRLRRRGTMQLLLCFCRVLGLSPRLWEGPSFESEFRFQAERPKGTE